MDYQQLLEIAEREIRLNLADDDLLRRAVLQSGGLAAEARQNYWRLRANQLREQIAAAGTDAPVLEIVSRLDAQDRRLRSRKERARWIWALACIAALIGCVVCPWLALSAYHHGSRGFYALVFLSVSCLVVAVISYTACRYHTAID